jgi:hypothetical protein
VSPRRNHRRRDAEAAIEQDRVRRGVEAVQAHADGDWLVRKVAGSTKAYRCPGCDQEIGPGVEHLVAWPADERGDLTDRRHWHAGCWRARARRAPAVQRSRSAPRYG